MSDIAKQVHDKFKVFVGKLAEDKTIGKLADGVSTFASTNRIAAKSVGLNTLSRSKA